MTPARAISLALLALGAGPALAAAAAPRVGQRHPDFTLPAIRDRNPVSLADYRGKKVLLVHFASW